MTGQTGLDTLPTLLGVHATNYKNLADVWLPWSNGVAIFGENGAGKTNLLEVLAILFGTDQTVLLSYERFVALQQGSLSFICEVSSEELPLAPSEILLYKVEEFTPEVLARFPVLARMALDAEWWRALNVTEGWTFYEGLLSSPGFEDPGPGLVWDIDGGIMATCVRYTLESFSVQPEMDETGQSVGVAVHRRFSRMLLAEVPEGEAQTVADVWPELFVDPSTPLPGFDGFIDLLPLPDVGVAPVVLEWLPNSRSSRQANRHLTEAFQRAQAPAKALASQLATLPIGTDEFVPDTSWWLHLVTMEALAEELSLTLPHLSLDAVGYGNPHINLIDRRRSYTVAGTGEDNVLEYFSAGERRWVDEALATAARALDRMTRTAGWQAALLEQVPEAELIGALGEITEVVQQRFDLDGFWSGEVMMMVMHALDVPLLTTARSSLAANDDVISRGLLEARLSGLDSLRQVLTIRVFDEPEAHLHPTAQRKIAGALESLRLRGQNIVLVSHSPLFLDLPSWELFHAQNNPEGTAFSRLDNDDLGARRSLSGTMGWSSGELLTLVSYVLIVEGEHDRVVLDELFGRQLRDAGVAIVRMFGTEDLMSTAEMDFIDRYLDVPIGVLLDYVNLDRVSSSVPTKELTQEERYLRKLRQACQRRARQIDMFGLRQPDIVAYLSEEVVRDCVPAFPGWHTVLQEFKKIRKRPSFKPWLFTEYGVDFRYTNQVQAAASQMTMRHVVPASELNDIVRKIELRATAGRWPDLDGATYRDATDSSSTRERP